MLFISWHIEKHHPCPRSIFGVLSITRRLAPWWGNIRAGVLALSAALWLGSCTASLADSPLPPPEDLEVHSPNGQCVTKAEVNASRIVAFRIVDGRLEKVWTFPEYRRFYAVADDCRTLITFYPEGGRLTLQDRNSATVVFTFYEDAAEVKKITLGELYPDLGVLMRTASHWAWYRSARWVEGIWTVDTIDGRTVAFDVRPRR
jgi:hypothetical protein